MSLSWSRSDESWEAAGWACRARGADARPVDATTRRRPRSTTAWGFVCLISLARCWWGLDSIFDMNLRMTCTSSSDPFVLSTGRSTSPREEVQRPPSIIHPLSSTNSLMTILLSSTSASNRMRAGLPPTLFPLSEELHTLPRACLSKNLRLGPLHQHT